MFADRPESWKITLPCTRAEAEAIDAGEIERDVVLMTTEEVEDDREHWRLDAYVEHEPGPATIAHLRALVPSAAGVEPVIEALIAEDWVTLSQAGLAPIREGRFVVHTSAHPADPPTGGRAFLSAAGQAFGTGHHATTSGCLAMLDALADETFATIIDLGTGTGLLAFAAAHLWPAARVMATDIDPKAIMVTAQNAAANRIEGIDLIVADGARAAAIAAGAPYDLVIANILAGPLIAMAPEVAAIAASRATIVLAGLLESQRDAVVAAFVACGCSLDVVDQRGDWSVLRLIASEETHVPADAPDALGRDGWALDI